MAPHLIEPAATGRSKCRGCGERIETGELRFGESVPNPFAEGDTTQWFHLECAAFKRPESFLATAEGRTEPLPDAPRLLDEAKRGVAHRRLPRVNGAERSPSARAQCRSCHANIPKGEWRITLVFYEEGRFLPSGFVHATCALAYFETVEVLPRLKRFAPGLSADDLNDIQASLQRSAPA
jgi:hypothetical protein